MCLNAVSFYFLLFIYLFIFFKNISFFFFLILLTQVIQQKNINKIYDKLFRERISFK